MTRVDGLWWTDGMIQASRRTNSLVGNLAENGSAQVPSDLLPPKVASLHRLIDECARIGQETGLCCFVPEFVHVPSRSILSNFLAPELVDRLSTAVLQDPTSVVSDAIVELNTQLRAARDSLLSSDAENSPNCRFIIRSAGIREDGEQLSFAGVYDSIRVDVLDDANLKKVGLQVAMSPYKPRALRYHFFNGVPVEPIDVIVQKLVPNAVALNITVTSRDIASVLISGLPGGRDVIFRPNVAEEQFVNSRTNLPVQMPEGYREIIQDLIARVKRPFQRLAAGGNPISIECAFDKVSVSESSRVTKLALLQLRSLPVANPVNPQNLPNQLAIKEQLGFIPVDCYLKPGPCTFDSIVSVKNEAVYCPELGIELTVILRHLREKGCTRPLLVLGSELTRGRTSGLYGSNNLNEVALAWPFVGLIDQAHHTSAPEKPRDVVLAGHIEALVSESRQIVVNSSNFLAALQSNFPSDSPIIPIMIPSSDSTSLDQALSRDLKPFDPGEFSDQEDDLIVQSVETSRASATGGSSAKRPRPTYTEVYRLNQPLTIEVVSSGNRGSEAVERFRSSRPIATHQLEVSRWKLRHQ